MADQPVKLVHITTIPETLYFLTGQVGFMKSRGLEVHAISSPGDALEKFGHQEGIAVYAVDMPRRITPLRDLIAIGRLWRTLRAIRPQIVHANTPKGGLLGIIAAWLARVPVRVYHVRGLPFVTATGAKRRLLRLSERISCLLATQVLSVSHTNRDVIIAEGLCSPHKIKVLLNGSSNGVNAVGRFNPDRVGPAARQEMRARFNIPSGATVIGFVGRIVRDKGLVELAAAWTALREEFADLRLLLVGPFEPQDPVPEEVKTLLQTDERIHLSGMVEPGEMPAFYAAMDLLVLPTYREGFPNVPMEAAAMGLPVVASRVPGCIEAVEDGVTGTLVPVRDAAALTEALRRYLADPALRTRHGQAGRARMLRDFAPEALWHAQYQEYVALLERWGRGGQLADRTTSSID